MTKALITDTVRDYFEGWFDGDVERMDRALHPELVKRWPGEEQGATLGITTKERMLELTAEGAGTEDGADRTLDIRVDDLTDDTATVTVHSAVYREYLHLVRTPEGWQIVNAWWQFTDPEAAT